MGLISFTYRAGRVVTNVTTGTLDGTGTPALIPVTLAKVKQKIAEPNNREAGPGYLDTHITPGTLGPCRPINFNSLDNKGRNHESNVKEQPPFTHVSDRRGFPLFKGRPQKQLVPTGITEGEKT